MSDPNTEDAVFARARRGRNLLIALSLAAFVIIVFVVTIAKLMANGAANHTL
ncbi:MAG TPA: hypothetical protein VFC47_15750 [Caulobacteraceae bacterium]|nr:hypothetical protein [Caulobacteraceae bacterium]